MLQWFRFFPVPWRTGATFVHDVFSWVVFAVVFGHIVMAVTHRESLKSIFTGRISDQWGRANAARWVEERSRADKF